MGPMLLYGTGYIRLLAAGQHVLGTCQKHVPVPLQQTDRLAKHIHTLTQHHIIIETILPRRVIYGLLRNYLSHRCVIDDM